MGGGRGGWGGGAGVAPTGYPGSNPGALGRMTSSKSRGEVTEGVSRVEFDADNEINVIDSVETF